MQKVVVAIASIIFVGAMALFSWGIHIANPDFGFMDMLIVCFVGALFVGTLCGTFAAVICASIKANQYN